MQGRLNLQWAYHLIDGLTSQGANRAVIAPGSRSTPLALACESHPKVQTWVQIDERCAGFFALGLADYGRKPVLLIATSGSAPAHWYPAVIEADQRHIPLLLLSADRPPEAQGWHANQTTDQSHLFGGHVRAFHQPGLPAPGRPAARFIHTLGARAAGQSLWPRPGPVHINQPFREPLVPARTAREPDDPAFRVSPSPPPELQPDRTQLQQALALISGKPGLIICGPGHHQPNFIAAVAELAQDIRCPVFADPLSGLRFGAHLHSGILAHYDAFLRNTESHLGFTPEWVLRFGAPPVSKTLFEYLLTLPDSTQHLLVAAHGDWPDPLHLTSQLFHASPLRICTALLAAEPQAAAPDYLSALRTAEQMAVEQQPTTSDDDLPFEGNLIRELLDALPAESLLLCGNSMPIRQLDTWSGTGTKPLRFVANRGVSGIDGHISTLLGLSAAAKGQPVVGLIGDLAFYHDMNGLLAARPLDAVIIVLNNGGGGIFGYLPQSQLPEFERYWLTPTGLDLRLVARLYQLGFQRVERQSEFSPALAQALREPGVSLIEVMIDREQSTRRHLGYWDGIARGALDPVPTSCS